MKTRLPAPLIALLAMLPACGGGGSSHLHDTEVEFLSEDVLDLMTVLFQAGENSFLGDAPLPGDVLEPASAQNGFTVLYDLPPAFRPGLGFGSGDVALKIVEEGVVNPDPLSFSFDTTGARFVDVVYDLRYLGETLFGRPTDLAIVVTAYADRVPGGWVVEYFVEADCWFGAAFARVDVRFRSPGVPRDGVEPGFGDGEGFVDDPDVFDILALDLDFGDGAFRAQGDVGCCAYFDEDFFYEQVF